MRKKLSNLLGWGLLAGMIGFAVYFFGFGQTFEGRVRISAENDEPGMVGLVTFQSRFKNRRFLTHAVYLDLKPDTPVTYRGEALEAGEAAQRFDGAELEARLGYREEKSGWGYVVSLDLEPPGSSPKEILLVVSLLLIFGSTIGMAVIAKMD